MPQVQTLGRGTFFHRYPILGKPLPASPPEHLGPVLGILVQNGCFSQNAGTNTNATHGPHRPPAALYGSPWVHLSPRTPLVLGACWWALLPLRLGTCLSAALLPAGPWALAGCWPAVRLLRWALAGCWALFRLCSGFVPACSGPPGCPRPLALPVGSFFVASTRFWVNSLPRLNLKHLSMLELENDAPH